MTRPLRDFIGAAPGLADNDPYPDSEMYERGWKAGYAAAGKDAAQRDTEPLREAAQAAVDAYFGGYSTEHHAVEMMRRLRAALGEEPHGQ